MLWHFRHLYRGMWDIKFKERITGVITLTLLQNSKKMDKYRTRSGRSVIPEQSQNNICLSDDENPSRYTWVFGNDVNLIISTSEIKKGILKRFIWWKNWTKIIQIAGWSTIECWKDLTINQTYEPNTILRSDLFQYTRHC